MKAMLLAAGFGTRLKPFTDKHPKALATVNGRTLLEHNIRYLQRFGIRDVIVNVHHFADQIESEIKTYNGFGSNVTISDERHEVLETGGGLLHAKWFFEGCSEFIVMNTDVLTDLNLNAMLDFHRQHLPIATLAVMNRSSSRNLLFDESMTLGGWKNNQTGQVKILINDQQLQPFAFSGIQILTPGIWNMPFTGKFSLIDLYLHLASTETIKGYQHTGDLFVDAGKPESLKLAETLFP